ncbi:hypothetical protein E2562_032860 [Oryza meyeriana var. granulata]|uniref:Uncharacterized protein n=1 Tax=Oryza meyeriana var. granulata TaxID=110450 RepID=A0A6G1BPK3_9ORYZ|nr:hypothetical protein E2562_032860 [Oryza meyeriana var. granulata]
MLHKVHNEEHMYYTWLYLRRYPLSHVNTIKAANCVEEAHRKSTNGAARNISRMWIVALVEVRPSLLSGEAEKFLFEDIHKKHAKTNYTF